MSHHQHEEDKEKAGSKRTLHQSRIAIESAELQDPADWSRILPLCHEDCAPVCDEFMSQLSGVTNERLAKKIIGAIFKPKKKLGKCPVCQSEDKCEYVCDEYKEHLSRKKRNEEAAPLSVEFKEAANPVTTSRIQVIHKRKKCKKGNLCSYCLDGLKCIHKCKRKDKKVCDVLRPRSTDKYCSLNDQFPPAADDTSAKRLRISTQTPNIIPIIKEEYQQKTTKSVFCPRQRNKEEVLFKIRHRNDEIVKHYTNFESINYATADDEEDMDDDEFFEMLMNMSSDSDIDLCAACSSGAQCEDACQDGYCKPNAEKKRHPRTKSILSDERKFRKRVCTDPIPRDYSKEKISIEPQMAKNIADDFLNALSSCRNEDSCEPICKEFRRRLNELTQQNHNIIQGSKYKNLKVWDDTESFYYTHEGKPYRKKLTSGDLFKRNFFRKGDWSASPHERVSERRMKSLGVIEPKYEIGKRETISKEKPQLSLENEKPRTISNPPSSDIKLFHAEITDDDDSSKHNHVHKKSRDLTLEIDSHVTSPPSSGSESSNDSLDKDKRPSQRERVGESAAEWRRQYWERNPAETKEFQGYSMEPVYRNDSMHLKAYDSLRTSDDKEDDRWLHEPTQEVIVEPNSPRTTKISFNENVAQYDTNANDESVQTGSLSGVSNREVRDRNTDHPRRSSSEMDYRYSEDVQVIRRKLKDIPSSSKVPSSALEFVIPEEGSEEKPQYFLSNTDNRQGFHSIGAMTATESLPSIQKIPSKLSENGNVERQTAKLGHGRGERQKYLNYFRYSIFGDDNSIEENKKDTDVRIVETESGSGTVDMLDSGTQSEISSFIDEEVLNRVDGLESRDLPRTTYSKPTQFNIFPNELDNSPAQSVSATVLNNKKDAKISIQSGTPIPSMLTTTSDDVEYKRSSNVSALVTMKDADISTHSQPALHSILTPTIEISKNASTELPKNLLKEKTNMNTLFNAMETKDANSQTLPSDYVEMIGSNTTQSRNLDNQSKNVRIVSMNNLGTNPPNTYNNPKLPLNSTLTRVDDVKLSGETSELHSMVTAKVSNSSQLHLPPDQGSSIQSVASLSDDTAIDLKGSNASTNLQSPMQSLIVKPIEEIKSDKAKATTQTYSDDVKSNDAIKFPFQTVVSKPSPAESFNKSTDVQSNGSSDSYLIKYDSSSITQITPPGFSDMDVDSPSARFFLEEDDINSLLDDTIPDDEANKTKRSIAVNTNNEQKDDTRLLVDVSPKSIKPYLNDRLVLVQGGNDVSSNKHETQRSIAVNTETTARELDNVVTLLKDSKTIPVDHNPYKIEARRSTAANTDTEIDPTFIKIETPVAINSEITKIVTNNASPKDISTLYNTSELTGILTSDNISLPEQTTNVVNEEWFDKNSLKLEVSYANRGSSTHPDSNVTDTPPLNSIAFSDHDATCETTDACQRYRMQASDSNKATQMKVNCNHQPQAQPQLNTCCQHQPFPYFINLLNCPLCATRDSIRTNNLNPTATKSAATQYDITSVSEDKSVKNADQDKEEIDPPLEICSGCCEQGQQTEKVKHRHRRFKRNFDQNFIINVLHTTKILNNTSVFNKDGSKKQKETSSLITNNSGIPINLKKNTLCILDDLKVESNNKNFKPEIGVCDKTNQDNLKQYLTSQVNFIKHQVECSIHKNQSKTDVQQPTYPTFQQSYEVYTVATQQNAAIFPTKTTELPNLSLKSKIPGIAIKSCETFMNVAVAEELNPLSAKISTKNETNQKNNGTQKNMTASKEGEKQLQQEGQQTCVQPLLKQSTRSSNTNQKHKGVCDRCKNPASRTHAYDTWTPFQRQLKNTHNLTGTLTNQQKPIQENPTVSSSTQKTADSLKYKPGNLFKNQTPAGVCENLSSCSMACDNWKALQIKLNSSNRQQDQETSKQFEENQVLQINQNNINQQQQETNVPLQGNQNATTLANKNNSENQSSTSDSFSDDLYSVNPGILKVSHDNNAMEDKSFKSFKSITTMTKETNSLRPISAFQSEFTLNPNSIRDSIVLNEINYEKRASQKLIEDDDNTPLLQTGSVHWNNQPEVLIESPIDNVRVSNSIKLYQQIDGRRVGNQSIDTGYIGDSRQRTVSIVVDATPEEETKMFSDIVDKPESEVVNNEYGSNEGLCSLSQESKKSEGTQISSIIHSSESNTFTQTKDVETANILEVKDSVTFEANGAPNKFEAAVESEKQSTPMQCIDELLEGYEQTEIPQMQIKKRLKVECFFVGQCPLCKNKIICRPNYEDFQEYITKGFDKEYLTGEKCTTSSNEFNETKGFKETSKSIEKQSNTFSRITLDKPLSAISENYPSNTKDTFNSGIVDTDIVTSGYTLKAERNKSSSTSTVVIPGSEARNSFSELDSSNTESAGAGKNLKICPQCRCDIGCNPICHAAKETDVNSKICQTCTCEMFLCNPLCLLLKPFKKNQA